MPTHTERFEDDLDFDPSFDEIDVDELLAEVEEDTPYQPPRRARRDRRERRDRTAWRRIETRRERRLLKKELSDWGDEGEDYDWD